MVLVLLVLFTWDLEDEPKSKPQLIGAQSPLEELENATKTENSNKNKKWHFLEIWILVIREN